MVQYFLYSLLNFIKDHFIKYPNLCRMINHKKNNEQAPNTLGQEQLVYAAIHIMTASRCKYLPLHKNGKYIGNLWLRDLIYFIETGSPELSCHKLNYDLYSAFYMIYKSKHEHKKITAY